MANICDRHQGNEYHPACIPCKTTIEGFFGREFAQKIEHAKSAGHRLCRCGFSLYSRNYRCPLCHETIKKACLTCDKESCEDCWAQTG